jgi:hypothetical protein
MFTQGSARRALGMARSFDRYHFIDASPHSVEKLRQYIDVEHAGLKDRVVLRCGDVNEERRNAQSPRVALALPTNLGETPETRELERAPHAIGRAASESETPPATAPIENNRDGAR